MRTSLLIIFLLILMTSCEKEDTGLRYYHFQQSDEQWFTDYKKGDTLTFVSDDAPTRKYVVWEVYDSRKAEWNPSFVDDLQFYYDRRYLELYRLDNPWPSKSGGRYDIYMSRFPIQNAAGELNLTTSKSRFTVRVFFDDYNEIGSPPYLNIYDSENPSDLTSLTIEGKIYNEVVYIKSNNPNSFCGNCPNVDSKHDWVQRVNQVYYHKHYGIIQFSDLDGVTWQIKR